MPIISVTVEEQFEDLRSDHCAYKLVVKNSSDKAVRLLGVEPRIPSDARLIEIIDTSVADTTSRRTILLGELNRLLQQYLLVTSESFRDTHQKVEKERVRALLSPVGIVALYIEILTGSSEWQERLRGELETFSYRISSTSDAEEALRRWLLPISDQKHEIIASLFEAKTLQLSQIEHLMDENERRSLINIEAGGVFTATYVLKFQRRFFDPKKYQLAFDVIYEQTELGAPQTASGVAGIQISPSPFTLSLFAIFAAILGVTLRVSLTGTNDVIGALKDLALSGQLLVGPIVALIFFNVFEYTSMGKNFAKMSVSWRSALLIGALCGIAQDRILAALKAFITLQGSG